MTSSHQYDDTMCSGWCHHTDGMVSSCLDYLQYKFIYKVCRYVKHE